MNEAVKSMRTASAVVCIARLARMWSALGDGAPSADLLFPVKRSAGVGFYDGCVRSS